MLALRTLLLLIVALAALPAAATADPLRSLVAEYVREQTQGLPGRVGVSVGQLAPGTQLPPCERIEAYTPGGSKLWGKTHVGVQCLAPRPWKVLIPVQVSVAGAYVATARPLVAGMVLQAGDLTVQTGDLAALPTGIVTDAGNAVGKTLKYSLAAGQPLRSDQLLAPLVIRQGQTVRVVSRGAGFSVSGEGKAINNAAEGQVAQVRMPSGQLVSGLAKADGSVEILY